MVGIGVGELSDWRDVCWLVDCLCICCLLWLDLHACTIDYIWLQIIIIKMLLSLSILIFPQSYHLNEITPRWFWLPVKHNIFILDWDRIVIASWVNHWGLLCIIWCSLINHFDWLYFFDVEIVFVEVLVPFVSGFFPFIFEFICLFLIKLMLEIDQLKIKWLLIGISRRQYHFDRIL